MDRHDRLGARRDRRLDERRDPCRSRPRGRPRRRALRRPARMALTVALKREADRDDLVARADAERPQDGLQGDGAVGHEDGVPDAAVGGPRLPRTPSSAGPSRACRSEGRRGRPPPRPAPMSGFEIGITRTSCGRCAMQRSAVDLVAAHRMPHTAGAVPRRRAATGRPVASARRCPQAQTQPSRRAGLPATSAWSGTSRVTTAPAPTVANRPTSLPATTTAPAPIERPCRRRIGLTTQSSARASSPSAVMERGNRSLVRIAFGPMKTPSSTVTPW